MAGLSDLSDRAAVLAAIDEFDAIGREAFLQRYGFGPARSYFIEHEGKRYDSKAIVGAALGFQTGTPLRGAQFVGGDATVAPKLESLGFEVTRPGDRNPPWSRDELILALDLYVRRQGRFPPANDPAVLQLSQVLHQLQRALGASGDTLRNSNGVAMKLTNFRAHDPTFADRAGLTRGNRLEKEVWDEFASDALRLSAVAAAIRATLNVRTNVDPLAAHTSELEGVEEAVEGRAMTVRHIRRERNHELVRSKKERAKRKLGRLAREACDFDFLETYGARGEGFIECHHTRPVSEMAEGDKTRLEDLALVCSNCHRMIHARRP